MKNKKGFTLIELLAVIVILAIIALIATPMVLRVVENARKSAAQSSALGWIDAVEKQMMINAMDSDQLNDIQNRELTVSELVNTYHVKAKGTIPEGTGTVTIQNQKVVSATLKIGKYDVTCNGQTCTVGGSSEVVNNDPEPSFACSNCVYTTPGNEISSASNGTSNASSLNRKIYLGYPLVNGEIASGTVPSICAYSESTGGELCLRHDELSQSRSKVLQYFGYDEETWDNISETEWESPDDSIVCEIEDAEDIVCRDSEIGASVNNRDVYVFIIGDDCPDQYCGMWIDSTVGEVNYE